MKRDLREAVRKESVMVSDIKISESGGKPDGQAAGAPDGSRSRIAESPGDPFSAEGIRALLTTSYLGRRIVYKEVTGSTNDDARRLVEQISGGSRCEDRSGGDPGAAVGPPDTGSLEGTVVVAGRQTGGKGRLGRRWVSRPGGIFMSAVVRPAVGPERIPLVAIVAGYAVATAVGDLTGLPVKLKWPNDVLAFGKKISGILCEPVVPGGALYSERDPEHHLDDRKPSGARTPYVICGIGINANQTEGDFPEEIRQTASSIRLLKGQSVDRNALAAAVLNDLEAALSRFEKTGLSGMARKLEDLWAFLGEDVVLQNRSAGDDSRVYGTFVGVDAEGRALIDIPGEGLAAFSAGDLSLRPVDDRSALP